MAKQTPTTWIASIGLRTTLGGLVFLGILLFWVLTLESIGLHGDESWFGTKAAEYLRTGINQPLGMTPYTGILQSACAALVFKFFGIGVAQLRITGVVFNAVGLLVLLWLLGKTKGIRASLSLLLLFTQSSLYMLYPKVAWEVCSFTLFLSGVFAASLFHLSNREGKHPTAWALGLLGASLLGMHNHIIFSSLPLATLAGLVTWKLFNRDAVDGIRCIAFLVLNIANLILYYYFSNHGIEPLWNSAGLFCYAPVFALLALELLFLQRIIAPLSAVLTWAFKLKIPRILLLLGLLSGTFVFARHHGTAVWQIITQKIIYLRVFSYEPPPYLEWLLIATGAILLVFLGYAVVRDLFTRKTQPFAFILLAYVSFFSLYTTDNSIRYYLLFFAISFVYLAHRMVEHSRVIFGAMTATLLVASLLIQSSLWQLSLDQKRRLHALHFPLGDHTTETSAHFLRFDPVLKYMHRQKIGRIETKDPVFIGRTYNFYRLADPRLQLYPNVARIDYDYELLEDGFRKHRID